LTDDPFKNDIGDAPDNEESTEFAPQGNTGIQPQEIAQPEYPHFTFNHSFWIVFAGIAVGQVYGLILAAAYGFDLEKLPPDYYWYSEGGGVIWYVGFLAMVLYDLRRLRIPAYKIFNINYPVLQERIFQVLKYFGGCALFVVASSFLSKEGELNLESQTQALILLTLTTTVIIAPIFEEMIFRGYLYTAMFSSFKRKKERMVVNAMLFAAAHVFLVSFILGAEIPYYIFVLGYLLAKLYEETRSILPGILLHALNNLLVFGIEILRMNAN
jgi:membrane protease YdiL (CAAX protease family)